MKDPERLALAEGPVRVSRVADVVADRIRDLIIDGKLADGDRLPPLDALLEEFSISGPSMREALRVLESEGLITVQRGSVGGSVVHRPEPRTAAYTIALVLRSRSTELHDVFDALALLVPMCAMLCARRSDRKKAVVPELRRINVESRRPRRRRRRRLQRVDDGVPQDAGAAMRERDAHADDRDPGIDLARERRDLGQGDERREARCSAAPRS